MGWITVQKKNLQVGVAGALSGFIKKRLAAAKPTFNTWRLGENETSESSSCIINDEDDFVGVAGIIEENPFTVDRKANNATKGRMIVMVEEADLNTNINNRSCNEREGGGG